MAIKLPAHSGVLFGARQRAMEAIDEAAEATRLRYITPGAGQAMVYQTKGAEASDLLAGGAGPHPLLEAEAIATGVTVEELAASVVAMMRDWTSIAAIIEARRLAGKASVRNAVSIDLIQAAADATISHLRSI